MDARSPGAASGSRVPRWLTPWLATGLLALGCGPDEAAPTRPDEAAPTGPAPTEPAPPSILLISIDTLRADHLSAYGYPRPTPHIDSLAADGVLYEEAHSPAPWTLPAHASLLTGWAPARHRLVDDDRVLPGGVPTLAALLSRQDYRCAAFVSHAYVSDGFGLDRGFASAFVYEQYRNSGGVSASNVLGDTLVERVLDHLRETRGDPRPFFLFVHLFDPHWPYAAPPPYRGRYSADYGGDMKGDLDSILRFVSRAGAEIAPEDLAHLVDLYDEEIAWTDHLVGRLITAVRTGPRGEDAVIALTSDHGEEFMEHGSLGHALTLYREQSHVPLIVSAPGRLPPGERVTATVSTLDVAPTLLRLAGLDPAALELGERDGRPLPEPGAPPEAGADRVLTMHTTRWGPRRLAVRKGDRKAIAPMSYAWGSWSGAFPDEWVEGDTLRQPLEVFDLSADPGEEDPLELAPTGEALRTLRRLQEHAWRGVRIEVETPAPLELVVRLPDGVEFRDEPALSSGRVVSELPASPEQRVRLGAPGRWVLRLPVVPGPDAALGLRVEGVGESVLHLGGERRPLAPGEEVELALARAVETAPLAAEPDPRPQIAVRARQWGIATRAPELDTETREALEALGYADPR